MRLRLQPYHFPKPLVQLIHFPHPCGINYVKRCLVPICVEIKDKFVKSPGLKHWADIQNLKIAASSYSAADSIAELEKQIASKSALPKTTRASLVETEHQLKDLGQILKYAEQYKSNHIYHIRYQKSKDKDRYLRQDETELLLHDGAENMLKRLGINTKTLDTEKLRSDYNTLYSKKTKLQKTYKSAEKECGLLTRKLDNLNQYINRDPTQILINKMVDYLKKALIYGHTSRISS